MPEYIARPPTFIAVQYTGTNASDVDAVLNAVGPGGPDNVVPFTVTDNGTSLTITTNYGDASTDVAQGEWVLSDGTVYTNEAFTAAYTPAPARGDT